VEPWENEAMKRFKGTVKNNAIVLEKGVNLPEGAEVEVRVRNDPERAAKLRAQRNAAVQRILDNSITHPVGMDEIIEEDKREREERWWPEDGAPK
jgi:hypothetical protein